MVEFALAVLGAGTGAGLTLVLAGLLGRDEDDRPAFRRSRDLRAWWARRPHAERWRWPLGAATGAAAWLVTGWPVAGLAVAGLVVFLPWLFSAGTIARRRIERLDAIEDWLRHLADVLGPGHVGLVSALQGSAREAPAAIAVEVNTLAQRLRTWDVQRALLAFAEEIDDQVGDAAAAGLCVAHQQGAGVARLLQRLASAVADEVTARRSAEAERARRRSTARILLALWALIFTGFAAFGSGTYTSLYDTTTGQLVLGLVLALVGLAAVWLRQLGVEPSAPRFLASSTGGRP
ncbi:type II secretion system F family protein [Amycolatopsis aidingensis]|uniref:type II secretion system F family protein n=1 Tax=Amycolatopsis aidingensis TaxID=2842453 RepID=UPI001C0E14BB|nr:type II secretion system F family protein [Amycolatopsis aidingensis]